MSGTAAPRSVTLALTGASGMAYGLRLLECLLGARVRVALIYSQAAQIVAKQELDLALPARPQDAAGVLRERFGVPAELLQVYGREDWYAPIASGSSPTDAMVICPCSMGTLAAVAGGLASLPLFPLNTVPILSRSASNASTLIEARVFFPLAMAALHLLIRDSEVPGNAPRRKGFCREHTEICCLTPALLHPMRVQALAFATSFRLCRLCYLSLARGFPARSDSSCAGLMFVPETFLTGVRRHP